MKTVVYWKVMQGDNLLGRFENKSDAIKSVKLTWSHTTQPEDVILVEESFKVWVTWTHF